MKYEEKKPQTNTRQIQQNISSKIRRNTRINETRNRLLGKERKRKNPN